MPVRCLRTHQQRRTCPKLAARRQRRRGILVRRLLVLIARLSRLLHLHPRRLALLLLPLAGGQLGRELKLVQRKVGEAIAAWATPQLGRACIA